MHEDSRIVYWHPDAGWSARESGATRQLALEVRTRVTRQVDARLSERVGAQWQEIAPDGLSAHERGQQWQVWRITRQGVPLVIFEGMVPLEPEVLAQAREMKVRDEVEGIEVAPLASAGARMCLSDSDASRLIGLLRQSGAVVTPMLATPGRLEQALAVMEQAVGDYEARVAVHLDVLRTASGGITLDLPRIEAAEAELWVAERTARAAHAELIEARDQALGGASVSERARAQADEARAEGVLARLERARSAARAAATAAARVLADSEQLWPPVALAPQPHEHLAELAAHWAASGVPVALSEEGLIIGTPGGERVHLGETVRVEPAP